MPPSPPGRDASDLFDAHFIAYDLGCHSCEYNLRGLKYDAQCPECGYGVRECRLPRPSACRPRHRAPRPATPSAARSPRRPGCWACAAETAAIEAAAKALGVAPDATLFVYDVPRFLLFAAKPGLVDTPRGVSLRTSGVELCAGFRDYAELFFGARAPLILERWELRRSEDLGRVLLGLLARGLLDIQGVDFGKDFAGLFTLERLFTRGVDAPNAGGAQTVLIRWPGAPDRDAWLAMREALWPECPRTEQLKEMEEYLAPRSRAAILVADVGGGKLVGFVEAAIRPRADGCESRDVGYIEGWYVEETYRRRGVGRQLVEAAEDWARSQGCTEMASDCLLDNDVSLKAHLALGYVEKERLIHFARPLYEPGQEVADVPEVPAPPPAPDPVPKAQGQGALSRAVRRWGRLGRHD